MATSKSGARCGGSDDVDGPRSPPKPPSPRAKIDRFWRPQRRAVRRAHGGLRPDHCGLALVPDVGEPGDRATGARRWDRGGRRDGLAGMQHPRELDVDAGKLHRRRFGHVEAGRYVAESRQHLRGVVDQVAQLTRIHRVAARTQPEVVELDIATGPREFDGIELGARAPRRPGPGSTCQHPGVHPERTVRRLIENCVDDRPARDAIRGRPSARSGTGTLPPQ